MKSEEGTGEDVRAAIAPHRKYVSKQVDGGWHIAIYDKDRTVLIAEIVTTTEMAGAVYIQPAAGVDLPANVDLAPSMEYWWFHSRQLTRLAGTIYLQATRIMERQVTLLGKSFDPRAPTFTSEESTTWAAYEVANETVAFEGRDQHNIGKALYLRILVKDGQVVKVKWFSPSTSPVEFVVPMTGEWAPVNVPLGTYQAAFSLGSGS